MQALIPIYETQGGSPCVSARDLHTFLESRQEFTAWIKGRIAKYGFAEGTDFLINLSRSEAGRQTTEYVLSLDTAKEVAMVEANAKGQQARRYFIEAEKQRRQPTTPPQLTTAEMILQLAQQTVEAERRLVSLEQKVAQVEAQALITNTDYYTIAGYASLHRRRLTPSQANAYGRTAAALSKHYGHAVDKIHDARYGQVNSYHVEVLKQTFGV
ncbi:MAG: antA/AntB antirepressor family protein [Janthinobacterium lividum]